jgi:formimidoylglutamate deiminase
VPARAYLPDLLYAAGALSRGAALVVERGAVAGVGAPPPGAAVVRLPRTLVLPGLVSAHGHAFQRAIRGRTERRAEGRDDFWTWRRAMYEAASRLGPDDVEAVARMAFHELARAGVTAVGEFHYLHHDPDGRPYADPSELALRVVRAARDVGLRVVLLRGAYARAGHGLPPDPLQRRFVDPSPDAVLAALDRLVHAISDDPLASAGLAPHSVRACPEPWIAALAGEARRRGLPLHLPACEQPAEVSASRAEHGVGPVGVLARAGALGPRTTLVHAIHLEEGDAEAMAAAGAIACACPLTERNLGDGVVPADRLRAAGVRLALGVDSHAEADLLAEARALELHLRLVRGERNVLDDPPGSAGRALLEAATAGGMASLGLPGGRLAPGEPADFVAVDLDHPSIAGAAPDALLDACVFGLSPAAVRRVFVAGEPIVEGGEAAPGRPDAGTIVLGFRDVMRRLWGAAA